MIPPIEIRARYIVEAADLPDRPDLSTVDYYTERRLTIVPRTVEVFTWTPDGERFEYWARVEGDLVRQSDGARTNIRRGISYRFHRTRVSDNLIGDAPEWLREIALDGKIRLATATVAHLRSV